MFIFILQDHDTKQIVVLHIVYEDPSAHFSFPVTPSWTNHRISGCICQCQSLSSNASDEIVKIK